MEKLAPETTRLLKDRGWSVEGNDSMLTMASEAACLVMSELVDVMSSTAMPPLTSDSAGFRAQCNALLCELRSPNGIQEGRAMAELEQSTLSDSPEDRLDEGEDVAFVVARVPRLAFDGGRVSPENLKQLLRLRSDAGFEQMRANYYAQVGSYVDALREATTAGEQGMVHDAWEQRLTADRAALKKELRAANLGALVDSDAAIATLLGTVAGTGTTVALGPIGVAIGLAIAGAGIAHRARERRRAVAEERWTSWLFEAERGHSFGLI